MNYIKCLQHINPTESKARTEYSAKVIEEIFSQYMQSEEHLANPEANKVKEMSYFGGHGETLAEAVGMTNYRRIEDAIFDRLCAEAELHFCLGFCQALKLARMVTGSGTHE